MSFRNACSRLSDSTLLTILLKFISLEEIDLTDCTSLSSVAFRAIGQAPCNQHLRRLILRHTKLLDDDLHSIVVGCSELTVLVLHSCYKLTGAGVVPLSMLHHLKSLNLRSTNVGDAALTNLPTSVEELDVSHCPVNDAGVVVIASRCSALRSINLTSDKLRIHDTALALLALQCPRLERINVRQCPVTEEGLISFARACHSLRDVKLRDCGNAVTNAVVAALAQSSGVSLRRLNLRGCRFVDDSALFELARHAPQLEVLDLTYAIDISDNGVVSLVAGCPYLRVFILDSCFRVTDAIVGAIAEHSAASLQVLSLSGCDCIGLSDCQLLRLAGRCHHLTSLDLSGTAVTPVVVERLLASCTRLSELVLSDCPRVRGPHLFLVNSHHIFWENKSVRHQTLTGRPFAQADSSLSRWKACHVTTRPSSGHAFLPIQRTTGSCPFQMLLLRSMTDSLLVCTAELLLAG